MVYACNGFFAILWNFNLQLSVLISYNKHIIDRYTDKEYVDHVERNENG